MYPNKIKQLRQQNNITREQMAEQMSVSLNTYGCIERGETMLVDIDRIKMLAEIFKISPLELGVFDRLGNIENL